MINLKSQFIADELRRKIQKIVTIRKQNHQILPTIVIIHANDLAASNTYIKHKIACAELLKLPLIYHKLPPSVNYEEFVSLIYNYNNDNAITGIIIQLPLYIHLLEYQDKIVKKIILSKDVEAITNWRLSHKQYMILPCTASAVIKTLASYHLIIQKQQRIVIIGKSIIVGRPLFEYFSDNGYQVLNFDKESSREMKRELLRADFVVSAAGVPGLITENKIKKGAIVIDVGFQILPNGQITGDVDWKNMKTKAQAISPVPGGVGGLTVLFLFYNALKLIGN